jgi:hypothetical protein
MKETAQMIQRCDNISGNRGDGQISGIIEIILYHVNNYESGYVCILRFVHSVIYPMIQRLFQQGDGVQ